MAVSDSAQFGPEPPVHAAAAAFGATITFTMPGSTFQLDEALSQ